MPKSNLWMLFAMSTVLCWGFYGIPPPQRAEGHAPTQDDGPLQGPSSGSESSYFLIAVLAPAGMLLAHGASWSMPMKGVGLSLVAGVAGAVGAFCVLLAFGAKGNPAVVKSIVFAGAPVVNAIVTLSIRPPAGGWDGLKWQFIVGILMAAAGGMMVTQYKPD